MKSKKLAAVNTARCAACGACMNECPKQALSIWRGCYAVVDDMVCVGCARCAAVCPADCITVGLREEAAV